MQINPHASNPPTPARNTERLSEIDKQDIDKKSDSAEELDRTDDAAPSDQRDDAEQSARPRPGRLPTRSEEHLERHRHW